MLDPEKMLQATKDWYNANADDYSEETANRVRKDAVALFIDALPLNPNGVTRILDAGCGAGHQTDYIRQQLENRPGQGKVEVIGIDFAAELLERARRDYPNVTFEVRDLLELGYVGEFDGIWSWGSLLHLPSEEHTAKVLSGFHTALKENGTLFTSVKAQSGEQKIAVVSDSLSLGTERPFIYFTLDGYSQLLTSAGFRQEKIFQQEEGKGLQKGSVVRKDTQWIIALSRKRS